MAVVAEKKKKLSPAKRQQAELKAAGIIELERRRREEAMRFFKPITAKGIRENLGHEPFGDIQADVWKALAEDPELRILLLLGGNRSCKTATRIQLNAELLCHDRRNPLVGRFGTGPISIREIGIDKTNSIEGNLIPYYKATIIRDKLKGGTWDSAYSKGNLILTAADESFLELMTYGQTSDQHQGVKRHGIGFDEWPPEDIWEENTMRIIDYGGIIIVSATPTAGSQDAWAAKLEDAIVAGQIPHTKAFYFDPRDNYYVNQKALAAKIAEMTDDQFAMRIRGKRIPLGGLVVPEFSPMNNVIENTAIPDHWPKIVTMDVHIRKENYYLFGAINIDHPLCPLHVWQEGWCDGTAEKTNQMVRISGAGRHIDVYKFERSVGVKDHNTGINLMQKFQEGRQGLPWVKWDGDPWTQIEIINAMCKQIETVDDRGQPIGMSRLLIHRKCAMTIKQLLSWSFKDPTTADRTTYTEKVRKVFDHLCDCLRHMVEWAESYKADQNYLKIYRQTNMQPRGSRRNAIGQRW